MIALAWRLSLRELRGGLRGFRILLACMALGVAAIAAIGSVRTAIETGLQAEGAALLGGDAVARFTYRFANEDEAAWMAQIADQVSETVDFRSMIVVEGDIMERALTQVQAVDGLYPLIGDVQLDPPMPLSSAFAGTDGRPGAVIERALADRLALTPGDIFKLGTQEFTLSALLISYPDNSSGGFGLGPRSLVLLKDLQNSGLLAEGTLMESNYRLDLPPDADLSTLKNEAELRFSNTGMRWRDGRDGAPGIARFVDRIASFLVLVGLSGLTMGGIGVSSSVSTYLSRKTNTIATLKTLGASKSLVFFTYFFQVSLLAAFGILIGLLLGGAIPVLLAPLIDDHLPIPAEFSIYPVPLIEAAIYGVLTALIFTLWPLSKLEDLRPAILFRGDLPSSLQRPSRPYLISIVALILILIALAALFSGTVFLTLWTAGGIVFALALLLVAAAGIRAVARRLSPISRGWPTLRLAIAAIGTRGSDSASVVLSLGLGLSVLAAIGQIDGNLRGAITDDLPEVAPSYFFVDIQPDQIDGFRARLENDDQVSRFETAPMLRGIITQINGQPASEFGDHWVLRGDRGITYSDLPDPDTVITDGTWWPEAYAGPPLISFAAEEAKELGLNLGDALTVNILGRDITATIASFREVSFENAGIGFVMSMNPAALAGAPHSWISTVYSSPEGEAEILRDLAGLYPNITAIRVRDAIDQVAGLLGGIAAATRYGALVTLATGFLVLIGAAASGERARTYEAAILKTLGASRWRILASFALRSILLGFAAGFVALAAGLLGGWAVSTFIMDNTFRPILASAILIILGGIGASALAGLGFAWRPLGAKPARVLRARE